MPFDLPPSQVKTLLPTTTGSRCEAFKRLLNFPTVLNALVSYLFNESGGPSDQFQTDLCALGCVGNGSGTGSNPPNLNMPAPQGVNATDGSYSDKVRVTWLTVTPPTGIAAVTQYKVYRSLATNTDPNEATLIATVTAPTLTYDDEAAAQGTVYNYWVRATNGTETSAYGGPDNGSADAPATTMDPIADLLATQGFSHADSAPISLVFTRPTGATKFTVFRNTVNDFATATEVITDIELQNTADHFVSTQSPDQAWDNNDDQVVIYHFPPSATTHYYFWVTASKDSPPAETSAESNAAQGWVRSFYAPFLGNAFRLVQGESATEGVEFAGSSIRVVLFGPGGGGAGGSQIYGGGGGGGGGVIVEEFAIAPGDVIDLVSTPVQDETGNAPAVTNGDAFTKLEFRINGVVKMIALGGAGGEFSASGGGIGGAGAGGSGTTAPTIYTGADGNPGVGPSGGSSGYRFGNKRYPAAHYAGYSGGGYSGDGPSESDPGGGSFSAPGTEVLAVGGSGRSGFAVIVSETL